jgi:hypothetical protein
VPQRRDHVDRLGDPAAPVGLRAIERGVGARGGFIEALAVAEHRRADADPDPSRRERRREGDVQPLGRLARGGPVAVVEQDEKLVAAGAGEQVGGAQRPPRRLGDRAQRLVAGAMAVAVVQRLEPVEIDRDQPDRAASALRTPSARPLP